ncbi:DUF5017 domain-containing protein [Pedobacter rhodius]|uniref:DUF5017 domain-containing protein n=1 Tax=Pedobacter rhodius TaxID=3004098 RepID=A0ABT4KX18_9SPHI|nr:DUF5017 domain-containing protein [Pedobacter sp. SJ11]MCZ4223467.1 DUF5017 domain-containing protein [Pedobacter sp. SJ11]
MKKRKYLSILLAILFLGTACRKDYNLEVPLFEVTANKTNVVVNEPVEFAFRGVPDNISFYSGEPGKEYVNTQRSSAPNARNIIHFTTQLTALAAGNTGQIDNLRLFVSNDFSGSVDSAGIRNATWTDITSRAKFPAANSTAATISDSVNVADFRNSRDTLFLAFRYRSTINSAASRARRWTMSKFIFQNKFPNGTVFTHGTIDTDNKLAGFNSFSYKGTSVKDSLKWSFSTSATFEAGVDGLSDEDWLISRGFKASAVTPDKAVGIKKFSAVIENYSYAFTKPGTYIVTFVANNATGAGVKEVVKQLTIKVN